MISFNKVYVKLKTFMKENLVFLFSIVAVIFFFQLELPYVIYTPGGSIDLSERIEIENGYETTGSLSMAYVSMIRGNIPFLLFSYFMPNWDIVPEDDIKPENESIEDMIKADQISLLQAQNNAILSAFHHAGKEVNVKNQTNHIIYISEEAKTELKLFDELISINDKKIDELKDIQNLISNCQLGETVKIQIKRDDEIFLKTAEVYETKDGLKIGISIATTYEYETDPHVEILSKSSESGPSGGLMMALSIYNSLIPEDITKGKKIIGTGTINQDGTVGAIGGVKYKLLGAVKKKADIFLVPEENYDEVVKVKKEKDLEIRVISVKTLEQAIRELSFI